MRSRKVDECLGEEKEEKTRAGTCIFVFVIGSICDCG